jgi:hypothetical protein
MGWNEKLIRPIEAAEGDIIVTLADARKYLLKLPKDRHDDPTVAAAVQALLMAAEGHGPILHAQVGIGKVITGSNGHQYPDKKLPTKKWRRRR